MSAQGEARGTGKRTRKQSSRLTNTDNVATPAIQSHQPRAPEASQTQGQTSAQPSAQTPVTLTAATGTQPTASSTVSSTSTPIVVQDDDGDPNFVDVEDDEGEARAAKRARPNDPVSAESSSESSDSEDASKSSVNKRKDIEPFFEQGKQVGKQKKAKCKLCKTETLLVNEVSTLRRHMGSKHKPAYLKWIEKAGVESMLAEDRKNKAAAAAAQQQSTLDPHLREKPPAERVIKYTDEIFKTAAISWLVATNQPIGALNHPSFVEMIDVASRAEDGVKIPSNKETRKAIIDLFKKNLKNLKKRLSSDKIGDVSMTCDGWQASNTDAYFATTAHWIEESPNGTWELRSALIGFTKMNTSHDGVRLGRALYKTVKRLGIQRKVGWVTCDNASNNSTMLRNFAVRLNSDRARAGMEPWDPQSRHIRCLAHVINLATQAVISTYSKSKHFNPEKPDEHEEGLSAGESRDEVGLIRAITVKVRSSAKRKETFRNVQISSGSSKPLTMLMDMPVRWSSTFYMLRRAVKLKEYVNEFLFRIARDEKEEDKKRKLRELSLSAEEWERAKVLLKLLELADDAQHAFSTDHDPALHYGLPALEALHKAWSTRCQKPRYARYSVALQAGIDKIAEYYDKTSTSHAYTMAMVLHPKKKMKHFTSHWDEDTAKEVRDSIEVIFKERHISLFGNQAPLPVPSNSATTRVERLLEHLASDSSDEEDDDDDGASSPSSADDDDDGPWMAEFRQYIDGHDTLPTDMPVIKWWQLNATRLPVWASLARDHLAIMASSVSSERAFSSAGITISKRRNRLHEDIVEALQFLKSAIQHDLLFREEEVTMTEEELEKLEIEDGDSAWEDVPDIELAELIVDVDSD